MGIARIGVQSAYDLLDLALRVFYLQTLPYLFAFRFFNRAVDFSHVPAVLEETVKLDLCHCSYLPKILQCFSKVLLPLGLGLFANDGTECTNCLLSGAGVRRAAFVLVSISTLIFIFNFLKLFSAIFLVTIVVVAIVPI